jgi:hypothetical protein
MNQQIIFHIAPDGTVIFETKGFSGPSCKDASEFIKKALGKVATEQLTPEYFQTSSSTQQQEARQ